MAATQLLPARQTWALAGLLGGAENHIVEDPWLTQMT
jgi:hypothetical protein